MAGTSIEVGAPAPDFTLPDQNGTPVSLGDLRGKWTVLYFYPKDDTPGCTKEACQFTESLSQFESLDARVIGVSPDAPEAHRAFIEKYDLEIDLLSDPEHEVLERYEAWGEKTRFGKMSIGVLRSTVVIDPEGRIAWRWKSVQADGHAEKVRARLAKLKS